MYPYTITVRQHRTGVPAQGARIQEQIHVDGWRIAARRLFRLLLFTASLYQSASTTSHKCSRSHPLRWIRSDDMSQVGESSTTPQRGRLSLSKSRSRSRSTHRRSSSSHTKRPELNASRILYPTSQQHPEPVAYPVLVLCMSELDSVPDTISDDELFEAVLDKLDPLAGEEGSGGYVLIVLAVENEGSLSGKGKARTRPGVGWWLWKWRRVPRKCAQPVSRHQITR